MNRPACLALLTLAALPSPARADFLALAPTDYAQRTIANYYGFAPTPPVATLVDRPVSLVAGSDSRANSYSDCGLLFAMPAGARILAATLTLDVVLTQTSTISSPTVPLVVGAGAASGPAVALADFAAPANLAANVGSTLLPNGLYGNPPLPVTFDVTTLVATFAAAGATGVFFQLDDTLGQSAVTFAEAPFYDPATFPRLTISYAVPGLGSGLLLMMGLVLIPGRRLATQGTAG